MIKVITEESAINFEKELKKFFRIYNVIKVSYSTCPIVTNGNSSGMVFSAIIEYEEII